MYLGPKSGPSSVRLALCNHATCAIYTFFVSYLRGLQKKILPQPFSAVFLSPDLG